MTRTRAVLGLLVAAAALLWWAPLASAHARLVGSTPAGGATVTEAPPLIRLEFDEAIESSFGGVQVFDQAGSRVPELAPPTISGRAVELPMTPMKAAGTYTVVFRVISADGHPVEARYSFLFEPPAPTTSSTTTTSESTLPPATPTTVAGVDPDDLELEDAGSGTATGLWLSRALNYLALALLIGFLATAVVFVSPGEAGERTRRRALQAAAVTGGGLVLTGVALFAFGLSNAAARGLPGVLTGELIDRFAETRFGRIVLAQAVVAAAATVLALAARRWARLAKGALVAAGVAALGPALWGHAGSDDLRAVAVANDWLHMLAITTWSGGLAALALLLLGRSGDPVEGPARRFSRLAGWALGAALVTGVVNALLHLGGVDQLTDTRWGKLVIVKVGLLAGIAAVGYLVRSRVLPQLRDDDGSRRVFARLVGVELVLMVLAFAAATQMANGIPADAEAASRVQSIAVAFGDGQLNLSVDPARTGSNVIHIYVLDATGRSDGSAQQAEMTLIQGSTRLEAELVPSGPGHWSALNQRVPTAGEWIIRVEATTATGAASASGAVTIR